MSSLDLFKYALVLLLPAAFFARRYFQSSAPTIAPAPAASEEKPVKSIMQPARDDLLPPKDDPFTLAQLKEFDGSDPSKPIYVSIKGTVFDVSAKADVYGQGRSYNIFAGKDGSKGLGMSSLKEEHAIPDYSDLEESDRKVLDDWHGFFTKRYNIVGRVIDHPVASPATTDTVADPTPNL
ncbi:putative steroid-binding protein 3 [Mycena sanguinolenta]|uniref:Putative steroid-binding protein 3 n=1 Tax=Mycena sanguinolenta TaxID=230812 RepID=A0A8H7DIT3_9AGAR|nr:putative steroid-binding protein 3 [Mycena sanguinolenta]